MPVSPRDSLLIVTLLSSGFLAIIVACILLALKFKQYRSRPYLFSCCFFLLQSLGIGGVLLVSLLNGRGNAHFDSILKPQSLICGFFTLFCLLAYIVEIKSPGKVSIKSFLLNVSPFIIISAILILVQPSPLHSFEELFNGMSRPDVWIRMVMVLCYLVYPIFVICQRYDWHQCLVSWKVVAALQMLTFFICPAYIAGMMCGYFPAVVINHIIAIVLDALVLYIEFKIRVPVMTERQDEHTLLEKTDESVFDNPEIWMNPDMSVAELCRIIGTNHTYLLNRIKSLGYSNYSDMINHKRVEFICKELEKGTDVNIINLMFEAGFRSRSTASREFRRIVGCTSSEYLESVSQKRKASQPE